MAKMGRPPVETPKRNFTIRMEPELVKRVEQAAATRGVSASKLIRLAILEYMERNEGRGAACPGEIPITLTSLGVEKLCIDD